MIARARDSAIFACISLSAHWPMEGKTGETHTRDESKNKMKSKSFARAPMEKQWEENLCIKRAAHGWLRTDKANEWLVALVSPAPHMQFKNVLLSFHRLAGRSQSASSFANNNRRSDDFTQNILIDSIWTLQYTIVDAWHERSPVHCCRRISPLAFC